MTPDFQTYKRTAIRYWERRRVVYNIALVPPSILAYLVQGGILHAHGTRENHLWYVLILFSLSALAANLCYSFVYVLEFFLGSDTPASRWQQFGRFTVFILGTIF